MSEPNSLDRELVDAIYEATESFGSPEAVHRVAATYREQIERETREAVLREVEAHVDRAAFYLAHPFSHGPDQVVDAGALRELIAKLRGQP